MPGLLYNVQNPISQAMGGMQGAASTAASMDKQGPEYEKPKKTVGGALENAAGGGMMGYAVSPMLSSAMPEMFATTAGASSPVVSSMGSAIPAMGAGLLTGSAGTAGLTSSIGAPLGGSLASGGAGVLGGATTALGADTAAFASGLGATEAATTAAAAETGLGLGTSTAIGAEAGSTAGLWGAGIGALIGAAAYLFS
jgi:hypothetical protein